MTLTRAFVDLTPLRTSPPFRRLWLGRVFSGFGSQMTLVAVMFQVWEQTRSTVWTGAVGLAQALPLVVFGLFAGSLVDRVDAVHVFSWWPGDHRLPLSDRADLWQPVLTELLSRHPGIDLLLEFVPDDDPSRLATEAATLRRWVQEVSGRAASPSRPG